MSSVPIILKIFVGGLVLLALYPFMILGAALVILWWRKWDVLEVGNPKPTLRDAVANLTEASDAKDREIADLKAHIADAAETTTTPVEQPAMKVVHSSSADLELAKANPST